ncbi:MAG: hypothetical protein IID45_10230 [Planctomycetes bacterium]|nr:hypothetical protein [Planctomycetota bacterium]
MTSIRAEGVAEVLWELKRADKVATYSTIAKRAGFSAGSNGRSVLTALKTVRRDWAHLQWWRAIKDDGLLEKDSEHAIKLSESGYEITAADGDDNVVTLAGLEEHVMTWNETEENEEAAAAEKSA